MKKRVHNLSYSLAINTSFTVNKNNYRSKTMLFYIIILDTWAKDVLHNTHMSHKEKLTGGESGSRSGSRATWNYWAV